MKKTITLVVMTVLIFLGSASTLSAQQNKMPKNPNYKKHAYWIQMMDDPNANYFEACEAFETFWENRGEPEKSHQGEEHEKGNRSLKRIFVSEEKLEAENYEYAADFKRFRQWKIDMAPFVQPDGSILSQEEQMEIWKKARE